ncbi:MAG: MaoC/PaaZ C-terminal domain-containing protein [Ornithinimicrobium sp.]
MSSSPDAGGQATAPHGVSPNGVSPNSVSPDVEVLEQVPAIGRLIAVAAARRGRRAPAAGSEPVLPQRRVLLDDIQVDVARLADYCHLMNVAMRADLPTSYLHVLTFPLQVHLMASRDFPFAMAGMVHIANTMTSHRPVRVEERLTASVHAGGLAPHAKGLTVDLVGQVTSEEEVVWQGRSTYLVRGAQPDRRERPEPAQLPQTGPQDAAAMPSIAQWRVGADLGRRYAAIAGDVNPIHLNPLAAKAFGFPRAIAHGMWTHARALGALEGRLGDRHTVSVEFRKPILLPSTVAMRLRRDEAGFAFAVTDRTGERAHMIGTVSEAD